MTPAQIDQLFTRLETKTPEPGTELEHKDPFTLLVAVSLAARATDASVNKATGELFEIAGTPEKMVALGEDEVRERIKTISMYKGKAKRVVALSQQLLERHGGQVPRSREALEALPGVGRKTANFVLAIAFGEPAIAVDTHVLRVANRLGLADGETPEEVEAALDRAVPEKWKSRASGWLVLLGRYICKARKPACPDCPVIDLCAYEAKTAA